MNRIIMSDDIPVTGNPVIDTMTRIFDWLDRQIDQLVPRPPTPQRPAPADMTDEQLHHAIHDAGARLLNSLAPVLQRSFAGDGAKGDPRFPHALPTTVRAHVLMMFTQAHDSYGLSLLGLREHASASALGPIRNIAETFALTKWLLESSDEEVRRARAYRLTRNAIDQYRDLKATLERIAPQSAQTLQVAPRLAAAADRMRRSLTTMAQQDDVTIAAKPKKMSRLIEQYLPESSGYMLYALLSNAGIHPSATRGYLFYGRPGTGITDFDFKGLYHVRAYWLAQSISLHLDLCHLVAPVLGWQGWDAIADATQSQLQPLAEEAERRFSEPLLQAMANTPDRR
jgi:hypothetical protein